MEKKNLLNKQCCENWTPKCEKMKLDHSLTSYIKINSKWIRDLKCKARYYKILKGKCRQNTL